MDDKALSPSETLRILEEIRVGDRSLSRSCRNPQIVEACRLFLRQSQDAPGVLRSVAYAIVDGAESEK